MTDISTTESLLKSLNTYVKHFEIPNTREDLLAIASSILTFQQKQGSLAIAPDLIEPLIQKVVNQFNADTVINSVVNSGEEILVKEVNQWRQSLENQVLNTLNVYVKQFQPDGILNLSETILSIIPLVENVLLGKSEAKSLIQQVTSKFSLETALEQVVGSETLAIANKLVKLLQFGNLEDLLKKNILALDRALESVTESLVNNELEKILGDKILTIDIDSKDFMIKQVTLKLNIMRSSPPPSKSGEEIAKQLDDQIEILKKKRQEQLATPNILTPVVFGSLQVGIRQ